MTDDERPEEPDNHYGDLRDVRSELIDEHQRLKAAANSPDDPQVEQAGIRYVEGKRDATLAAVSEIEDLLTEWNETDDRDGGDGAD